MDGRAFLDPARMAAAGSSEAFWRAAVVHAYYALLLECRDAQARWGLPVPPKHQVHATVRLRFVYASDTDLRKIADALDELVKRRNHASYDLQPSPLFASPSVAQKAVRVAADALALLDAIEADSARRAAAIASITP